MTFGSLTFVEALCRSFVTEGIATVSWEVPGQIVGLKLSGDFTEMSSEELFDRPIPHDITATAISTFEALQPSEQNVVKIASTYQGDSGFTTEKLADLMDIDFNKEIDNELTNLCEQLTQKHIFSRVPGGVEEPARWLFGGLLRKVSRNFIVKKCRNHKERKTRHADSKDTPYRNMREVGGRCEKIANASDDTRDVYGNQSMPV